VGKPRTGPAENGSAIIHNNGFDKQYGLCRKVMLRRKHFGSNEKRGELKKQRQKKALQCFPYERAAAAKTLSDAFF
jgi:hypothetical protein